MGWALKNLSTDQRIVAAESLFVVKDKDSRGEWLNGLCPLHTDGNPSFGYNPAVDIFHCHAGCHKDGDLVDLYCLVHGLAPKDGFVEFKKIFVSGSEAGSTERRPAPGPRQPPAQKREAAGQPTAGQEAPPAAGAEPSPEPELPPVDLEQMRQAYAQFPVLPPAWLKRLWETRRWSAEAIESLGIRLQSLYRCRKTGQLRPVSPTHARIAIPIFDADGILQNIRLYDPAAKLNKIISWGKGTGENRLFPYPKPGDTSRAILCEGEGDTIAAISLGLTAHTQTAKRKKWPEEQIEPFAGREVVIAYDADLPGLEYAKAAADSLVGRAASLLIVSWPDYMLDGDGQLPAKHGQDLTDFLVRHEKTLADLEALLPTATVVDENSNNYVSSWLFFGTGVTGRYGFQPRLLAEKLISDVDLMFDPTTEQLYRWNEQFWEKHEVSLLKRQAILYLGDEAQKSRYADAVDQALHLCTMPDGRKINDCEGWICLKNGMFNIGTFELQPHRKDFYATFQVAVDFDPDHPEGCDRWRSFLSETVQTKPVIEQLQEFFGYCLTRETRYEMCLVKIGDGADGKSTVQKILRAMCGAENCTSVGFDALEDQFQRTMIYNKMVNMSSEVGGQVMESQYFKKIVSGDPITGSYKHKDGFEFVPFVKLVFAVNRMMKVKDNSDGWYRRLLPIWFKRQFLPGDPARDPHLEIKLLAEINGIFAWALVGLERLRQRGGFDMNIQETQDILNEYKRMNSPVHAFVEDCCLIGGPDMFAARTDLYRAYVSYCGRFGFGAMHSENFYNDIKGVVKGLRNHRPRLSDGGRPRGFSGIGLVVTTE